jgi:5'-nucleotidase
MNSTLKKFSIVPIFLLISCEPLHAQDFPLTVVYTNNNNGNIIECECEDLPYGGLARRKTVFDQIRNERTNAVTVDAGDFLDQFGTNSSQDELVIRLYEKLGYDAINIGDNELANETEFFKTKLLSSKILTVSATITDQYGNKVAQPYLIKTVSGVRIAFIGYTPNSSFQYFPEWKKLEVKVTNEQEKLKQVLDQLNGKTDMIILLSNAGDDEDYKLAKAFPTIDIIVGGHNQVELEQPVLIGKTIIVQAGGNGGYVGKLEVLYSNGKTRVVKNQLIPLKNTIKEQPNLKKIVDEFLQRSKQK